MNVKSTLFTCLAILSIAIVACDKKIETTPIQTGPVSPPVDNREYFWGQQWQKTTSGYEMNVSSPRLTDSAINKGIHVNVAVCSDWSPFWQLPLTLHDVDLTDTINLSYTAVPGQLKVIAKAPFEITWASDVFIRYQ